MIRFDKKTNQLLQTNVKRLLTDDGLTEYRQYMKICLLLRHVMELLKVSLHEFQKREASAKSVSNILAAHCQCILSKLFCVQIL